MHTFVALLYSVFRKEMALFLETIKRNLHVELFNSCPVGILVYSVFSDKEMPLFLEMNKQNLHVELLSSSSSTLLVVVMPL